MRILIKNFRHVLDFGIVEPSVSIYGSDLWSDPTNHEVLEYPWRRRHSHSTKNEPQISRFQLAIFHLLVPVKIGEKKSDIGFRLILHFSRFSPPSFYRDILLIPPYNYIIYE